MLQDDLDVESYQLQTDNFIEALQNGVAPLTTAEDGYETLRVSYAILESARTGMTIQIE